MYDNKESDSRGVNSGEKSGDFDSGAEDIFEAHVDDCIIDSGLKCHAFIFSEWDNFDRVGCDKCEYFGQCFKLYNLWGFKDLVDMEDWWFFEAVLGPFSDELCGLYKYPEVVVKEDGNSKDADKIENCRVGGLCLLHKFDDVLCFKEDVSFGLEWECNGSK